MNRSILAGAFALLVAAPAIAAPSSWEGEVFYQVFPRSFRDSNGDRIGDLNGIRQGLTAIKKLGCTAILLNPIQKSRVYHNYFPDDFVAIDPSFGSLGDFRRLVAACHRLKMKLVLDMEQQYVADGHPWFKTMTADPEQNTPFLWRKNRLDMWDKVAWYNGAKIRISPVNLQNPKVRATITQTFQFWADQGVDGFRLDHMMDDLDGRGEMTGLYAGFWTPLEAAVRSKHPAIFFVAEQADWKSDEYVRQILGNTPTDAAFAFRLEIAISSFDGSKIVKAAENMQELVHVGKTELTFLENHDTERFASFEPDKRKQRLAAALLMTLKGTPSIYYGQELGMRGVQGHGKTDGNDIPVRLAYRWTAKRDDPGTAIWYRGTGPWWSTEFSADYDGTSYQEEDNKPDSLLNWYRSLIHFRLANPALRVGSQKFVRLGNSALLTFKRRSGRQTLLIAANLSGESQVLSSTRLRVLWPKRTRTRSKGSMIIKPFQLVVLGA